MLWLYILYIILPSNSWLMPSLFCAMGASHCFLTRIFQDPLMLAWERGRLKLCGGGEDPKNDTMLEEIYQNMGVGEESKPIYYQF